MDGLDGELELEIDLNNEIRRWTIDGDGNRQSWRWSWRWRWRWRRWIDR